MNVTTYSSMEVELLFNRKELIDTGVLHVGIES